MELNFHLGDPPTLEGENWEVQVLGLGEDGQALIEVMLGDVSIGLSGDLDSLDTWKVDGECCVFIDRRAPADLDYDGLPLAKLQAYDEVAAAIQAVGEHRARIAAHLTANHASESQEA